MRWHPARRVGAQLSRMAQWLCGKWGHAANPLAPRCDRCNHWLGAYPEPDLMPYDDWLAEEPLALPAAVSQPSFEPEPAWVPGAVYAL